MRNGPVVRAIDFYSGKPALDWPIAVALTLVAALLGLGKVDSISSVAEPVSTLSGIFAATAVFVCTATASSSSLIMRVSRAAFPEAFMRTWITSIFALMLGAALPILAIYVGPTHHRLAECVVLAAIALNLVTMARVAWWIRFLGQAEEAEASPEHRTAAPEWFKR